MEEEDSGDPGGRPKTRLLSEALRSGLAPYETNVLNSRSQEDCSGAEGEMGKGVRLQRNRFEALRGDQGALRSGLTNVIRLFQPLRRGVQQKQTLTPHALRLSD